MKINEKSRYVLLGMFIMAIIAAIGGLVIPAIAAANRETAMVSYSDLRIFIEGEELIPKDATGKEVPIFIYEGTNYLPIRAVAEAFELDIQWEQETNTAYFTKPLDNAGGEDRTEPEAEDIESVQFSYVWNGTLATNVNGIRISFGGTFNLIDPDDFTDMVLTRDGVPVDNKVVYNGQRYEYGDATEFIFEFEQAYTEPGVYGFTGMYKGIPFEVGYYNMIVVEAQPLGEKPANSADLAYAAMASTYDGVHHTVQNVYFVFKGVQEALNLSDLTEWKVVHDGEETPVTPTGLVHRYAQVLQSGEIATRFEVLINEEIMFTDLDLIVTGYYMGEPLKSYSEWLISVYE